MPTSHLLIPLVQNIWALHGGSAGGLEKTAWWGAS